METEKPIDKPLIPEPVDELIPPSEPEVGLEEELAPPSPAAKVHPLSPGGPRFEQVYARGKQAEREAQALRERLVAAEAKLDVLSGKAEPKNEDIEYSWDQLETFISQGRISRAEANQHREDVLERKRAKKANDEFAARTQEASRHQALSSTLQAYIAAVPAILQEDSADRQRLDTEFDWVAGVQGKDVAKLTDTERAAIQLTALRNVYGPVDSLQKREASAKLETHQGLPGGIAPKLKPNPDQAILNNLTAFQKEHYNKMMRAGRYKGGWKEVVAELKWERKKVGR